MPCVEQRLIGCDHEKHHNAPCASIICANFGKNSLSRVQNPNAALDKTVITNSVLFHRVSSVSLLATWLSTANSTCLHNTPDLTLFN